MRALLALNGLTTDDVCDPSAFEASLQLMSLWKDSRWNPCDLEEPVEIPPADLFYYFAKRLRDMGAVNEVHRFDLEAAGTPPEIYYLYAEQPTILLERLWDVVAADLEGGYPLPPIDQ